MNPQITQIFPSEFKPYEITTTEKYDQVKLMKHMYSGSCGIDWTYRLNKYIDTSKNQQLDVIYTVPLIGRLSTNHPTSQMFWWNNTKYHALKDIYYDVDIANAQFVLLEQLMAHHGLPTDLINEYNNDREGLLKLMNIPRKDAKSMICSFCYDVADKKAVKKMPLKIQSFVKQIKENRDALIALYPQVRQYAYEQKQKKNKNMYNVKGSALAYIAQTLERICLIEMLNYFKSIGYSVGALIHDGMHVEKNKVIDQTVLNACQDYVFNACGFKIILKVKSFELRDNENVVKFDELQDVKNTGITYKRLNKEYLTSFNDEGFKLVRYIKQNNMYLIKSHTGSGKTTLIHDLKNKYPKYQMISLVSRRSLSDKHEIDFELKNYQKTTSHSYNEVFQIDSVDKIPNPDNNKIRYILIIDEIASLCSHLLNNLSKMSQNRLLFIEKIFKLINHPNCRLAVGLDYNINIGTINFIKAACQKSIIMYHNTFTKQRNTPINYYSDKNTFINQLKDCLNNGKNAFVCSNMNEKFQAEIVRAIVEEYKLKADVDYLLYSGNSGAESINTDLWKNKRVIFATPTILYGIDCNLSLNVFGCYYNASHLDAMDLNQQLNRERKPESINLYIENAVSKPYLSVQEYVAKEESFNMPNTHLNMKMDENGNFIVMKYIQALMSLVGYEGYRKSNHNNLRLQILELLRQKGYTDINYHIDINEKLKIMSKKEHLKKVNEEFNNYDSMTGDYKRREDIIKKLSIFGLNGKSNVLSMFPKLKDELIDLTSSENMHYFIDNSKFNQLMNYRMYKKGTFNNINHNNDIYQVYSKTDIYKMKLLDGVRVKLGLNKFEEPFNTINSKNYNEHINIENKDEILKIFRYRGKPFNNRAEWSKFYMKYLKGLFVDVVKSNTKRKKRITISKGESFLFTMMQFDNKTIKSFNRIIYFKKKLHLLRNTADH